MVNIMLQNQCKNESVKRKKMQKYRNLILFSMLKNNELFSIQQQISFSCALTSHILLRVNVYKLDLRRENGHQGPFLGDHSPFLSSLCATMSHSSTFFSKKKITAVQDVSPIPEKPSRTCDHWMLCRAPLWAHMFFIPAGRGALKLYWCHLTLLT